MRAQIMGRGTSTRMRGAALGLTATLIMVLTACGPAPWTGDGPDPSSTTTADVAAPIPNDLSGGSTQRELIAGPVATSVNYWSTLSMDRWKAGAVKPVSLSLEATVTPDDGKKVYLQKASMIATPEAEGETFDPLEGQVDAAAVTPGYLVLAPYSYSQTFNVGPVPEGATHVTIQFTYDFLVQTTPTSNEFAKQTATDTLVVAISPPAAPKD